ncbi:hypothetical protein NDU88_005960 [Pleurodeles waltl]|uniref:Uncharacterized protein n=1 Tax=Pleurodeles waltl TaxID=8319 RepID=A0AAV7LMQ0_PLEWA|nr:hypothetical protein NDU88_005960 [Pleurodeles waltl]
MFSKVPGRTLLIQHPIRTSGDTVARQRPYRIPEAKRQIVEQERPDEAKGESRTRDKRGAAPLKTSTTGAEKTPQTTVDRKPLSEAQSPVPVAQETLTAFRPRFGKSVAPSGREVMGQHNKREQQKGV